MTTEKTPEKAAAIVVPSQSKTLTQTMHMTVDREMLRSAILSLAKPGGRQDWCIACGAGASANPLDKLEALSPMTKEILGGKSLPEFIESLKDYGKQAWCIACGAGKDASPLDTIGNPADIPNELIDALAGRLISAIKVG